jgi:hypothetical protein
VIRFDTCGEGLRIRGMGIGVAVHGVIEFPGWGRQAPSLRILRHNRNVIRSLPALDPEWPFITRSMFAFAPYRPTNEVTVPQYELALIHFAGSYKNLYFLSADWIRKFEGILGRLCWLKAIVYNEFSQVRYVWDPDWPMEHAMGVPPNPPQRWSLKCYQHGAKEISHAEAIEGPYSGLIPGK